MNVIQVDPSVNVGNLIAFFTLLFVLYRVHVGNVERFTRFETKLDLMWTTWIAERKGEHKE